MKKEAKKAQMEEVFRAFQKRPLTMKECEVMTNIDRSNICRYVATWRRHGKITEVRKGICPITKHKAKFLSTDPRYFPTETQGEMFADKRDWWI